MAMQFACQLRRSHVECKSWFLRSASALWPSNASIACGAGRKSCAITTARRLGQFLGDERIKDKGLNCNYVVAKRPENLPTSERAIPVAIFSTEPAVARSFLRKWCGDIRAGERALHAARCCPTRRRNLIVPCTST